MGLQIFAGTSGLLLIAAAVFLYEGEEKQVQSVLENWWVQIDDLGRSVLSRHVAFYSVVATKAEGILRRFLGPQTFTGKSSLRVSLVVFGGAFLILGASSGDWQLFLVGVVTGILSCLPHRFLVGVLSVGFLLLAAREPSKIVWLGALFGGILIVGVFNLPFLYFLRAALREASCTPQELPGRWSVFLLPALAGLAAFLLLGLVAVVSFSAADIVIALGGTEDAGGQRVLSWISGSLGKGCLTIALLGPLLCTSLYSVLVVSLVVNKWLWPLPNRLLYAIQRFQLLENRGLLWRVGVALLTVAAMPWASAFEALGAYF